MMKNNEYGRLKGIIKYMKKEDGMISLLFHDIFFKLGFAIVAFFSIMAIISLFYLPYDPVASTGPLWSPPSFLHPFGTTASGQDLFSQWMYGSQPTLFVAFFSAFVAAIFGIPIGLAASYFSRADEPLMRLADIFLILPILPLLIVIATFVRPTNFSASIIIGVLSWPWMARTVRSSALSIKQSPYIEVARMSGTPTSYIMKDIFVHILPLVISISIFSATGGILFLAYMDYLGVGPITSYAWGTTLFFAQTSNALYVGAWWWIIPSGISIGILAMGLSLIGYSVENAYRGVVE